MFEHYLQHCLSTCTFSVCLDPFLYGSRTHQLYFSGSGSTDDDRSIGTSALIQSEERRGSFEIGQIKLQSLIGGYELDADGEGAAC